MVRLTARQLHALGETLRELANYGVAALVFGQFVGQQPISSRLIVAGLGIWLVLVALALAAEGAAEAW